MASVYDIMGVTPENTGMKDAMSTQYLDPTQTSFKNIRQQIMEKAQSMPDYSVWKDWYEDSAGTLTIDWLAAVASFEAYHALSTKRESNIETAYKLESILDLAAGQKGLLLGPQQAAEIRFNVDYTGNDDFVEIPKGTLVATIGSWGCYAKDNYILNQIAMDIDCVIGDLHTVVFDCSTIGKFDKLVVNLENEVLAQQFETLIVDDNNDISDLNGIPLECRSESTVWQADEDTNYVLRRMKPYQSIIYIGDGQTGWYDPEALFLKYTYLTYDENINKHLSAKPNVVLDLAINEITVLHEAASFPDKELIRSSAINYRGNGGTLVRDVDYEVITKTYFGGYLHDVYVVNENPTEGFYLLFKQDYSVEQRQEIIAKLSEVVDKKRALGMPTAYHSKFPELNPNSGYVPSDGMLFQISLVLPKEYYNQDTFTKIQNEVEKLKYKFARQAMTIYTRDFVLELSGRLGIPVGAYDANEYHRFALDSFINDVNINFYFNG